MSSKMMRNDNCSGKKKKRKRDLRRRFLALGVLLTVFCVSLYAIRWADAKSAKSKMALNKKSATLSEGKSLNLTLKNVPKGAKVSWSSSQKSVASISKKGIVKAKKKGKTTITCEITYGGKKSKFKTLKCKITVTGKMKTPVVYMTQNISSSGLMAVYKKLNWDAKGNTAVKVSTGEPPASNYLDPNLIKDVVQYVDGTIVECNTAYGGDRSSTAMHKRVAKDHGFTKIANVDIMDSAGSMTLPVSGGTHLKKNYVGKSFKNYDSFLILSHFKGHAMAGFGGAIKNISIGIASSEGKSFIHSGGKSLSGFDGKQDDFLESMAEAGKAVSDSLGNGKNIVYVNVMNNLSVDCDCDGYPAKPKMKDIGILASADPVALDQACVDLVYKQEKGGGASLVKRIESRNGLLTLEHAEQIGLGSRTYSLVSVD